MAAIAPQTQEQKAKGREVEELDHLSNADDLGSEYTMKLFTAIANPSRTRKKPRKTLPPTKDADGDDVKFIVPAFHPNDPTTNPHMAKSKTKASGGSGGADIQKPPVTATVGALPPALAPALAPATAASPAAAPTAAPEAENVPHAPIPPRVDGPIDDLYEEAANPQMMAQLASIMEKEEDDEFWSSHPNNRPQPPVQTTAPSFEAEVDGDSMKALDNFQKYAPSQLRSSPNGFVGARPSTEAPLTPPPQAHVRTRANAHGHAYANHFMQDVNDGGGAPSPQLLRPSQNAQTALRNGMPSGRGGGFKTVRPPRPQFMGMGMGMGAGMGAGVGGAKGAGMGRQRRVPPVSSAASNDFLQDVFAEETQPRQTAPFTAPSPAQASQPPVVPRMRGFHNAYGGVPTPTDDEPAMPTQGFGEAPANAPMTEEERKFEEAQKRAQRRFYEKKLRDANVPVYAEDDLMTLKYLHEEQELKKKITKGGRKKRAEIENVIAVAKAINNLVGNHLPINDWDFEGELDQFDDAFEEMYRREFQLRGQDVDMTTIIKSLGVSLGKHIFDEVSNTYMNHKLGLGEDAGTRHRGPRSHPFSKTSKPPPPPWQAQAQAHGHHSGAPAHVPNPNYVHADPPRYTTAIPASPSTMTNGNGNTHDGGPNTPNAPNAPTPPSPSPSSMSMEGMSAPPMGHGPRVSFAADPAMTHSEASSQTAPPKGRPRRRFSPPS